MKIGLYSESAREAVTKIKEEIKRLEVLPDYQSMIKFREGLISSSEEHHQAIVKSPDFYSTSTLRDLLFHEQEHLFTIPMIEDALEGLGLVFCGFESDIVIRRFSNFSADSNDLYDLQKWHTFEQEHPSIFGGMYQFWCQKHV